MGVLGVGGVSVLVDLGAWGRLGYSVFAFGVLQTSFPGSHFFPFAHVPIPACPSGFGLGDVYGFGLGGVGGVSWVGVGFSKSGFPVSRFDPVSGELFPSQASHFKTLLGHGNHVRYNHALGRIWRPSGFSTSCFVDVFGSEVLSRCYLYGCLVTP